MRSRLTPLPLQQDQAPSMAPRMRTTRSSLVAKSSQAPRAATIKMLTGRCFRCLARDHLIAQCRDPIRCLECGRSGHTSRFCKSRRHHPVCSRLVFPPESIHSFIIFPPLPQTQAAAAVGVEHTKSPSSPLVAGDMEYVAGHAPAPSSSWPRTP